MELFKRTPSLHVCINRKQILIFAFDGSGGITVNSLWLLHGKHLLSQSGKSEKEMRINNKMNRIKYNAYVETCCQGH